MPIYLKNSDDENNSSSSEDEEDAEEDVAMTSEGESGSDSDN